MTCIVCLKSLRPVDPHCSPWQPDCANIFSCTGAYGSEVFDPLRVPRKLMVWICDDCMKQRANLVYEANLDHDWDCGHDDEYLSLWDRDCNPDDNHPTDTRIFLSLLLDQDILASDLTFEEASYYAANFTTLTDEEMKRFAARLDASMPEEEKERFLKRFDSSGL